MACAGTVQVAGKRREQTIRQAGTDGQGFSQPALQGEPSLGLRSSGVPHGDFGSNGVICGRAPPPSFSPFGESPDARVMGGAGCCGCPSRVTRSIQATPAATRSPAMPPATTAMTVGSMFLIPSKPNRIPSPKAVPATAASIPHSTPAALPAAAVEGLVPNPPAQHHRGTRSPKPPRHPTPVCRMMVSIPVTRRGNRPQLSVPAARVKAIGIKWGPLEPRGPLAAALILSSSPGKSPPPPTTGKVLHPPQPLVGGGQCGARCLHPFSLW